jgi:hypothetical protein
MCSVQQADPGHTQHCRTRICGQERASSGTATRDRTTQHSAIPCSPKRAHLGAIEPFRRACSCALCPPDAGLHARVYRAPLTLDLLCTDTFGDFQLWVRDHFTPTLVGIDSTNLWMRTHVQAPMYAFMIDEFLDTQEGSSCKHMAFGYVPQL